MLLKRKQTENDLKEIYSPQSLKDIATEKEKKMYADIRAEVEEEFYQNANLSRLFNEETPEEGLMKYAGIASAILSFITLVVVALK